MGHLSQATYALWKQRYHAPITWTQLAKAAPTRGLAISNISGVSQLYAWDVPTGHMNQLTNCSTGVVAGIISPDGRYIYYLEDRQGNEIGHYVRVPFSGGSPEDITPTLPSYSSWHLMSNYAGNFLGFTVVDRDGYHIYIAAVHPDGTLGAPRVLYQATRSAHGAFLSRDGEVAVVASTERNGRLHYSLFAFDTLTGEQIGELWDGPKSRLMAHSFSKVAGDMRLLATSNRSGVARPLLWNPRTGERIDLPLDEVDGELIAQDWSNDGSRILLCQIKQAVQQLYIYDLNSATVTHLRHPSGTFVEHPNTTFSAVYFGPDGDIFAHWQDSAHPPQLIALNSATGWQERVVIPGGEVPMGRSWRSVSFPSTDGQLIQGWLGVPAGEGPFPTILEMHGGPTAVMMESFSPASQAWLDHGFAFLTINYRGSTTFGQSFEQQIWGDLGHWEVEDMLAAHTWLVEQGIAYADKMLLTGWSYGGYLTLLGLGKHPEVWAGGMAGIAIADWSIQYEESADTLKGYQLALFGGTPQEKPEQYAASSPITYAEQIGAPILVIQGSNDTRCPARPMRLYESKLQALGKDIQVHWFEAGHGVYIVNQAIEHQELMLRFAYRALGLVQGGTV